MKRYAVVMAGGEGRRLYPFSRKDKPKQLLEVEGKTLIQHTLDRLDGVVEDRHKFISTCQEQEHLYRSFGCKLMVEPARRNTAPAVYYSVYMLHRIVGDGVVGIFPADHYVLDVEKFREEVKEAYRLAEDSGDIVLLGIKPRSPETGYGYIRCDEDGQVIEFVEKPEKRLAEKLMIDGLWNSGIYIARLSTFMEEFERFLPHVVKAVRTGIDLDVLETLYKNLKPESIDKGIAEKTLRMRVLSCSFGWSDLGNVKRLAEMWKKDGKGNRHLGEYKGLDTNNCIVYAEGRVATVGVSDLLIIQKGERVIVCHVDQAERVKEVAGWLEEGDRL